MAHCRGGVAHCQGGAAHKPQPEEMLRNREKHMPRPQGSCAPSKSALSESVSHYSGADLAGMAHTQGLL